jgi:threonine dehydrogenase-like Zn-dependent dehydrogenase
VLIKAAVRMVVRMMIIKRISAMIIQKVSKPACEPANPLQVINWICQAARKYSTISIPGVYGAAYDQFPLGQLFNRELQVRLGQCPVKKSMNSYSVSLR